MLLPVLLPTHLAHRPSLALPGAGSPTAPSSLRASPRPAAGSSVIALSLLQLNVVNGVSLSEDVKPLAGLPGLGTMNYPSTSPGPLVKHICAICGDRSSGTCAGGQRLGGGAALPVQTSLALGTGAAMWGRWGGDCSGSSTAASIGLRHSSRPHTVSWEDRAPIYFSHWQERGKTHGRGGSVQRKGDTLERGVPTSLVLTLGKGQGG